MNEPKNMMITNCSHEIVRDSEGSVLVLENNIFVRNKISGQTLQYPISKEICEIFGYRIEEEVSREVLFSGKDIETSRVTQPSPANKKWSRAETLALISLYKANYKDLFSTTVRNDTVYGRMSDALKSHGYLYNAGQIKDKIKYLKMRYSKWKDNMNRSGAAPYHFEYAEEMDDILAKKPNIIPTTICDTSAVEKPTDENTITNNILEAAEPTPLVSDEHKMEAGPSRKRKRENDDVERRHQERMAVLREVNNTFQTMMEKLLEKL